jgi:transglutaminase-like putative cysteine protease
VASRALQGKGELDGRLARLDTVWAPEFCWVDFAPTNGVMPSEEHITLAYGGDCDDVSPVSGVLLGGSRQAMSGVDVAGLANR